MNRISDRIEALRRFMQPKGISAFIVPSTDPHSGEYVPAHWESRKWISGFTGSAGTAVITMSQGGLWTDSRYFLQAEEQLQGSGLILFKDRLPGTPSIADWLGSVLKPGEKVGIDGWVNSTSEALQLQKALEKYHLELVNVEDPFHLLWEDRSSLPLNPPFILPLEYSGETCNQKISRIQAILKENQVNGILISALDEIAWTLNLRGTDVHCNPVFVSYLFITSTSSTLYIQPDKLTDEVRRYLETNHVSIKDYTQIAQELGEHKEGCLQLPSSTNYTLYQAASKNSQVKLLESPVLYLKSIKNATEIAGFKQAMTRDGVAMVRFLYWLENAVKSGTETELSIDQKLYEFRSAQENFQGISFDTIAGYQEHGAIVHYEATEETAATLKPEGFLLLDSGGQYLDGTTDITRTIALGHVTEEQKKDYTLILKGFIQLSMACFPYGTCGTQLDVLARQFIWKEGMNYGHGTGHGVGHFLSVHEGPQSIRMNENPVILQPGMVTSNEPGVYKAGSHGIRTENLTLVCKDGEGMFGEYLKFETITLCPICKKGIIKEMLTNEEIEWLNNYHQTVYEKLSPDLNEEEKVWLQEATASL